METKNLSCYQRNMVVLEGKIHQTADFHMTGLDVWVIPDGKTPYYNLGPVVQN